MNKYSFGKTSKARRDTCCKIGRVILDEAIETFTLFDFGIVCGHRCEEDQNKEFIEGDSKAKWGDSGHNVMKGNKPYSIAWDVAPYCPKLRDYLWDDVEKFKQLYEHFRLIGLKHGVTIIWGGNFKSIKNDNCHHEIVI
ncbi:hypothetical protein [Sulfurovum sp.]|uniref:hypothetical protein n=1 Tax=Sulfurovum sp. TaxID=1969726 RepID=UPI00356815CC